VTVPLAILKTNDIITFTPALPNEKLQSIKNLGLGRLDKLFLEFDEVFWDPEIDFFSNISD
jgi:lysine-specific histone demethylase 1